MKTFRELTETFDKPVELYSQAMKFDDIHRFTFNIDGMTYTVEGTKIGNFFYLEYDAGGSKEPTNLNKNYFRVLSTVVECVKRFLAMDEITYVVFSGHGKLGQAYRAIGNHMTKRGYRITMLDRHNGGVLVKVYNK